MKIILLILMILALGWWSCKKDFNPKPISTASNYLVVEGAISTGTDSTIIRLSRTVPLSSKARAIPELGAVVTIISDGGAAYPCTETGNGYYKSAGLNISSGNFGLKISTSNGKTYQSDLVAAKTSPPIDSVYYRIQSNGLEIYADTHDPANNTRYYRWDYIGTYQFHTAYHATVYLQTTPIDSVMPLAPADQNYICWRNDTSSSVLINTSAKLAKDVITQNALTFLSSTAEELESRYSILVKQYAITADAYNYYSQLKKNTEQLGGVFDPQPSRLTGNFHCVSDPAEPVIGYITAGRSTQSRIFIDIGQLPAWVATTPYQSCAMDTDLYALQIDPNVYINQVAEKIYSGFEAPFTAVGLPGKPNPIGYTASTPFCIDCTLRGTNKQPSFWTNE